MDMHPLDRLLADEKARPLGAVRLDAALTAISALSRHDGARNLMTKAVQAATAGDDARVERYVRLAAGLPYDELQERRPGWSAASFALFTAVVDALEAHDETDPTWLDVAESMLVQADPVAAPALRSVLRTVLADYGLTAAERRRCQQVAEDQGMDAWDTCEPHDEQERLTGMESVVRLTAAYRAGVASRSGRVPG